MEVVAGAKSAPANEDTKTAALYRSVDPEANIIMRLWRAELDIGAVEKSQTATVKTEGGQTAYTYKFTGYDKVVAAVKPALLRHGIKTWPTTLNHERVGNLSVVTVRVDFINVDNPADKTSVEMTNYGADKGDKGASKALTNAVREAIKKALGITSEEDDRADETTEFEAHEGVSRAEMEAVKERAADSIVGWAATFKKAVESAADAKAVGRLQAENAARLTSPDLPAVTKEFFEELLARRKRELGGK